MSEYILQVNNLCKQYGKTTVLDQVSLAVPSGSIYGLIGENGAGKTTLLRVLVGVSHRNSGSISMFGAASENDIVKARRNIGFMIETPALYPNMSVRRYVPSIGISRTGQTRHKKGQKPIFGNEATISACYLIVEQSSNAYTG